MTEVLLKELTHNDIDWLIATGHRQEIAADTILIQAGQKSDRLYILLDGTLTVNISQTENNPLAKAFAALEGEETPSKEITRLTSGEVVGEIPFIKVRPTAHTIIAAEKSASLSIPQQQLATKLEQDVGFASRFYRAIAILLSNRLQNLVQQLNHSKRNRDRSIRDVLFVLAELHDSDIDWLMVTGKQQKIAAETVLIREQSPVDALYILLDGILTLSVAEDMRNPLARAFAALDDSATSREIAKLHKGEIVGETSFITSQLPVTTVKAIVNSLVLSIPRQQLTIKLQQDIGFASRFYRVIATLLSNRQQGMLSQLGYGRRTYSQGRSLDEKFEYEDELEPNLLDRMALAGTRFNWMLKNLAVTSD